jgi:hypothetical protein
MPPGMTQYRVLASEGRQRYIYTKTHKNIKEKKLYGLQYESIVWSVIFSRSLQVIRLFTLLIDHVIDLFIV